MKKLLYILIIVISLVIPVDKADIAKLQPIEAVFVSNGANAVEIFTDTGDWGRGETVLAALEDLKANAARHIYLDTARYLLVSNENQIEELRKELKGGVRVGLWNPKDDLRDVVSYLDIHDEMPKLKSWNPGDHIPVYKSKKM